MASLYHNSNQEVLGSFKIQDESNLENHKKQPLNSPESLHEDCPTNFSSTKSSKFWWDTAGSIFRALLSSAQYNPGEQKRAVDFYRYVVAPNLGPEPHLGIGQHPWPSFMTDDFSPLEFSWCWGSLRNPVAPSIRLSFEAIGTQAGTLADPWNSASTLDLVERLRATIPTVDLEYFDLFSKHLVPDNSLTINDALNFHGYRSSLFLAVEFKNHEPTIKVYWLPLLKALQTLQPMSTMICGALESVSSSLKGFSALDKLIDFLKNTAPLLGLTPFIVATDCITVSKSRIKVYTRCQETSFASVEAMMSLFSGNQIISNGIQQLRDLWRLMLLQNEEFCPTKNLPACSHITAGMLYYFEVNQSSMEITTKVYIPVKHYGKNDQVVSAGLAKFLRGRDDYYGAIFERYLDAMNYICSHRDLASTNGLQTYISCRIKDDSLELTSYLSPQIYHPGRSWDLEGSAADNKSSIYL
ncbi:hypothetical protein BOTCAL_1408g00020 [Botryotinia calthae]|uniref:Dimethylallyl tryptophan synthase n=1 Tax=Botryotinia calthae TaxID=38488 RepID=A0A4Y8CE69_9HELO|nr:hypothetical protein BOTCAL_1408g00020 [Botryotinia calthae]